jgi:hypothetical protein
MRSSFRAIPLLLSLLLLSTGPVGALPVVGDPGGTGDLAEIVAELELKTDNADPDLIDELASLRTGEALDGLFRVYEVMNSVFMRREVLRGIAIFDGVSGEEQRALQKLMDAATGSTEREMRLIAADELSTCRRFGKAFLAMIVESSADDDVRERAMLHHTSSYRAQDREWYQGIFDPETREKKKRAKRGAIEEHQPHPLSCLRELAFEVLVSEMPLREVVAAARGGDRKVRQRAIVELDARGDSHAIEFCENLFSQGRARPEDRLFAADILLRARGAKFAPELIKIGTRSGTPEAFALGLADLLSALDDPAVNKRLLKEIGKGKGPGKLFSIRATRRIEGTKVDKALVKLLKDRDSRVVRLTMEVVAERKLEDALPSLRKLVDKSKDPAIISDALDAISVIRSNDEEWLAELVGLAKHESIDVRNGAIEVLGQRGDPVHLSILIEALAHEQWSTRLAAARGIERARVEEGVGAICERIPLETGRMALEFGEILWRLTGKPYRNQGALWARWWTQEGATFEFISELELGRLRRAEEARRLKQVSRSSFFGIKIESRRVIFILDVSGSMAELTRGQYVGERGTPRIDVARRELSACLDVLDTRSLFNMILFSAAAESWRDTISEKTESSLEDAKAFVARIAPLGGTNLYGAVRLAFEDPDVDTIYILSDGEPSVGAITDSHAIRQEVAEWNEHRGVVIHCIAIGGSLQVLEWIAEDTGGSYVKFP